MYPAAQNGYTSRERAIPAILSLTMRPFFKQTLASTLGSFLGITVFSGLSLLTVLAIFIGLASSVSKNTVPVVKDKTMLVLDMSADITDYDPGASLETALAGSSKKKMNMRMVTKAIDLASRDQHIVGIYLDGSKTKMSAGSGLATLREVRAALNNFRQSGKPIYAYDADLSRKDYYLASVATTVALNPLGAIDLNGFRTENLFYKGAFEKYGIGAEVIRVGKYKSAFESFSLKGFSPESRQENQELLTTLWNDFKATVGSNRNIPATTVQNMADAQGTLSANEALNNKFIDKILYPDQVKAELSQLGTPEKDGDFRQIGLEDYAEVVADREPISSHKVAVLYAQGTIVNGIGKVGEIGGDGFAQEVARLRQDKDIKAVVLRVNSPGGSATASDQIQRELKLLSKEKPLVVSMGNVAASGGYYISANARRIFAHPNTITGSIGVIGLNLNFQKLASTQGLTWDVVKTSKFADSMTVARPKTKEELAIAQKSVNQIYEAFLDRVAEGRNLPKPRVNEIAQGRVWSGIEAQKIGLVDELGGLEPAIKYAVDQAKLGKDWEIAEYPSPESFSERLIKRLTGEELATLSTAATPDVVTLELQKLRDSLADIQRLNDPRGVYARMTIDFKLD
jgi:protease IV